MRRKDYCAALDPSTSLRSAQDDKGLPHHEFHGLLLGAALDDSKVHAGCERSVLAKLGEAFTMTAFRADELSVDTDEMDNVIVCRSIHHQGDGGT